MNKKEKEFLKRNTESSDKSCQVELQKHIDFVIEQMKMEKMHSENNFEFEHSEHTQNQRRFEYDYEEDLYEPLYEDYD